MKKILTFLLSSLLLTAFGMNVGFSNTLEKQKFEIKVKLTKSELNAIDTYTLLSAEVSVSHKMAVNHSYIFIKDNVAIDVLVYHSAEWPPLKIGALNSKSLQENYLRQIKI